MWSKQLHHIPEKHSKLHPGPNQIKSNVKVTKAVCQWSVRVTVGLVSGLKAWRRNAAAQRSTNLTTFKVWSHFWRDAQTAAKKTVAENTDKCINLNTISTKHIFIFKLPLESQHLSDISNTSESCGNDPE